MRELTTNHRQKDNVLLEICNSLRLGHLSNDQALALAERQIKKLKLSDSQLTDVDSLLHIYPLCKQVKAHNDKKIAQLRHSGIELICLHAKDTYVAKNIPITKDHRNKLKNYQISKTGGIPSNLTIGMHVRVMLVRNINILQGLVNGAMGTIVSIQYPIVMDQNEFPETIKIKFDDIEESVAIHPVDTDFELVRGVSVRRKMFPLIHCFAATTHKVQGMTLNSAVVDLGDSNRSGATLYVALSRIININGLFIEDFSLKKLLEYSPNQKVIVEMERLRGNSSLNPPIKINRKRKKVKKPERIENVVNGQSQIQSEPNSDAARLYNVGNALIGTFDIVNFRSNFNVDDIDYATLVASTFVCAPWLNDRIVDASIHGLILQIDRPETIRFITCHYFATILSGNDGSHFLSTLFDTNVHPDLLVLPICISNHWILVIFRKMAVNYQCFYYDPITQCGNFSNYIHNAHQILMQNIQWIQCDYRIIEGSTQKYTNDCGVYVICFVLTTLLSIPNAIHPSITPEIRCKIYNCLIANNFKELIIYIYNHVLHMTNTN